jgi:hypothetical protein
MALPVLDGNQSATTLSSVVTGGEHIVAHTVVSLGSTAISNITSAISGSVVTVPSLDSIRNSVATDSVLDSTTNFIKIGGHQSGANKIAHIVHVSNGGAMSVDASGSSVTFGLASVTFSAVSISNFPASQTVAGTVTANINDPTTVLIANQIQDALFGSDSLVNNLNSGLAPENNIPISGTVTANVEGIYESGTLVEKYLNVRPIYFNSSLNQDELVSDQKPLPISGTVTVGNSVTIGSLPRVTFIDGSGSVTTANSAITVFASSTTRSYLLVQVTTGSAFVNVGATATTVNGINLTAGQGYAWETTIPQGLVSLISTTTSSRWVAKEA